MQDLFFSCFRRWYYLVVGLLITVALTFYVYGSIEPTYEADASIVLIPPKVAVTLGDNPFLYLGGLDQALGVLQVKMASPEIVEPLEKMYQGAEINVGKDATTTGPIAAVTVKADSAEDTIALLDATVAMVPKTLNALQKEQEVPADSEISAMELAKDQTPTPNSKRQIQMTALVALAGISGSLLLTGLLDRILASRKIRKEARSVSKADEADTPDGDGRRRTQRRPMTADPKSELVGKSSSDITSTTEMKHDKPRARIGS